MNEQNIIEYIQKNISKLSNVKDFSDNDFDRESRTFIAQLKEYGKDISIPSLLEKAGLNNKEKTAIEEACQVKESNTVVFLIKKALVKKEEDEIDKELKKVSDWFDSPECYRACYSRQSNFQGENKDFFNRFKEDVLPHIKKENYAALFIYLKSGNLKQDILSDLYKKTDSTLEVQKKIRERINELLIPIKIERENKIIKDLIVEDSTISFLNKNNIAKSGYIDVVMKSPTEKKLFISEVTANKIYDDPHDHIGNRDSLDTHLEILEKNSGYSVERFDFYKGVQKSFIEKNIKDFKGREVLIDKLFVFLNSNINNLVNYKNKNNIKIQMLGSPDSNKLNKTSDVYESFNDFLETVSKNHDMISAQLKSDIRDTIVESSKWIDMNMDLEPSKQDILNYRKKINIKNIEECINVLDVEWLSNKNLQKLKRKIELEKKLNIEDILEKNNEMIKSREDLSNKIIKSKKSLGKDGLLKFIGNNSKEDVVEFQYNFKLLKNFLKEISKNKNISKTFKNRATKALQGKKVKGSCYQESLIYETYYKLNKFGLSDNNQISYTNKNNQKDANAIIQMYLIIDSLALFSECLNYVGFKKDCTPDYYRNERAETIKKRDRDKIIEESLVNMYKRILDKNFDFNNSFKLYLKMLKSQENPTDNYFISKNLKKIEQENKFISSSKLVKTFKKEDSSYQKYINMKEEDINDVFGKVLMTVCHTKPEDIPDFINLERILKNSNNKKTSTLKNK